MQRAFFKKPTSFKLPFTMVGSVVAKVTASKDPDYPIGTRAILAPGWVKKGKWNPKNPVTVPGIHT